MFQPFQPFSLPLLLAFVQKGKRYFVRQTYTRPAPGAHRAAFLLSHYTQKVTAEDHFGAIEHDPNRFLYCWDDATHRARLQRAATTPGPYLVFAALFRADWEASVPPHFPDCLRQYIGMLGWQPRRDAGVHTHYEIQFGELFIRIRHGEKEVQVKLEEVERCGRRP